MTKIAKKFKNVAGVEVAAPAPNLLETISKILPGKKTHRGRVSRFEAIPNIKEALEILAKNGHNLQTAAAALKAQPGLEFVNPASLRFNALKMGVRFDSLKGPRKAKAEKVAAEVAAEVVKTEPAPVEAGPVAVVAHRPRGRRPLEITKAIEFLKGRGFEVK